MTTPTPRDIELARECREKVRCAMTGKAEIAHIADCIALARAEERAACAAIRALPTQEPKK